MKDSDILCVYDYCDHACGPRSSMWVDMLEFTTFLQNLCYENWLECTYVRCAEYWNFLIALFDMGTLYPVARSLGEQCFMMEPLQK
jgi:hypothetical protein